MRTPVYFGPEERPLFGWLHRPDGSEVGSREVGVVVVNPFGYEAICAHRSLRHLAERLAAAGYATLRFDCDGTGDSAGSNRDPDRVGAWTRSVHVACDALKALANVRAVAVVGLRLGALLAATAAQERDDVAALIALAPVTSGRRYARELKILQGALELDPPPAGVVPDEGVQEALGFALAKETKQALGKLSLEALDPSVVPKVLVLDRDDLPTAASWVRGLKERGLDATGKEVPGYVEMVLDPHHAQVPTAMLDEAVSWLVEACPERGSAGGGGLPGQSSCVIDGVREEAVDVGDGMFGVVSSAADGTRSGRGIVLLNAGSVHRVGPNRLYVRFARRWAAAGDVVIRCDVTGIGDSPPRPGDDENVVYGSHALDDVARVVTWMRARVRRVIVVGLCSGAYHGLKAAVAGQPIDGVVAINPLTFFYDEGEPLDARAHKVAAATRRYGRSVRDWDKWRKVLRGEVDRGAVARTVLRRLQTLAERRLRDVRRAVGRPEERDLGAELEDCAKRRLPVRFVFASGDPGRPLLVDEGGSAVPKLLETDMLGVQIIDNPDHTFTQLWSHELLFAALQVSLSEIEQAKR